MPLTLALLQSYTLSFGVLALGGTLRLPASPAWVRPLGWGTVFGTAAAVGMSVPGTVSIVALSGLREGPLAAVAAFVFSSGWVLWFGGAETLSSFLTLVGAALAGTLLGRSTLTEGLRLAIAVIVALGLTGMSRLLLPTALGTVWTEAWWLSLLTVPSGLVLGDLLWRTMQGHQSDAARLQTLKRELSASRNAVRTMLDGLSDAAFVYDAEGSIVGANKALASLFELEEPSKAVGTRPLDYAADETERDAALSFSPPTGEPVAFEWQCRTRVTGRPIWVEVQLTKVLFEGRPHGLAVLRDAVFQAKARLERALDSANIGFWEWSPLTGSLVWDEAMLRQYGLRKSEFSGDIDQWLSRVNQADRTRVQTSWHTASEGNSWEQSFRIERASGESAMVRVHGHWATGPGRTERMVGVSYDIRDGERDRSAQYLDVVDVILVALDLGGRVTLLNRKGCELLGVAPGSLTGKDWLEACVPAEQHHSVSHQLRHLLQTPGGREYTEYEVTTPSGERRLIGWQTVAVEGESGAAGTLSSGQDITEQRNAERQLAIFSGHLEELVNLRTRELEHARDAANAANEAKSLFLANMSHEIRTPMNSVLGFAQLLAKEPGLTAEGRHKVETIVRSGEQLLAIINDILEMSRIEAGRLELKNLSFDLYEVLGEAAQHFRLKAEEKGLAWHYEQDQALTRLITNDPVRLRQVLTNLLGNAIKFTATGSITLRAAPGESGRIVIDVIDSGVGIPVTERERLFQPFERTRSGKAVAGGTGLGLAISRRYAQLMGGDIQIIDTGSTGTCFRFEFEGTPADRTSTPSTVLPDLPTLTAQDRGTLVLVVDDMRANRELLRGMLEPQGYEVIEAAEGAEAVRLVDSRSPSIVLMDLLMPGMDGYEATRQIRQVHPRGKVTVIGVTASAFDAERTHFESSGLDGFLSKPFRFQQLHELISTLTKVGFEQATFAVPEESRTNQPLPAEWTASFREALAQGNITRLRQLGEAAREFDPGLSGWIAEKAARYELDELRGFLQSRGEVL